MSGGVLSAVFSLCLGLQTGFFIRDEFTFPTYMRIKVAVLEYHASTRQTVNPDLLDIIDPDYTSSKVRKRLQDL